MRHKDWLRSSNGRGLMEIAYLMEAFEALNGLKLELSFTMERSGTHFDLIGKISAWVPPEDGVEAKLLGCQSAVCSAMNLTTIEAAAIHLLYMMDGYLARREMRGEVEK